MSGRNAEKASKYIQQLYDARCNYQWQKVPELARKVDKHAPNRKCLTLASKIQAWLEDHPEPDGALQAENQFGDPLSVAIRQETNNHADVLDGSVCRAVVYYRMKEYDYALSQVPESVHRVKVPSKGTGEVAWGAVTVARGSLIRGLSFESKDEHEGAVSTYRSIISYLSNLVGVPSLCPALRRSLEELLIHVCLYFATGTNGGPSSSGEAIAAFHVLSKLLSTHSGRFLSLHGVNTNETPRQLWKSYYQTLSKIVAEGLVYHPNPVDRDHDTLEHRGLLDDNDWKNSRQRQKSELWRVERNYEDTLMKETSFPKASDGNPEVEDWVTQVMANWRVLCSPSWTEEELAPGGKMGVGRNTLDILYRAATKTFHSTQILRCLFTVHAFLGEFELAFKTFDSYVEIMERGKSRIQKSGSAGMALDDDDICVRLAAEAIRVACRYGPRAFGQKAFQIGEMMQSWLEAGSPELPVSPTSPTSVATRPTTAKPTFAEVSTETLVIAYRAIGISQAHWSRITVDPSLRAKCQEMAADSLSRSLRLSPNDADSTETLFAVGSVFSEMRRMPEAITHMERALESPTEIAALRSADGVFSRDFDLAKEAASDYGLESKKLPLRHLLSLLYSVGAIDDENALRASEEMLSPLPSQSVRRSTSLPSLRVTATEAESFPDGALKNMDLYDKKNIIELKMTGLVLTSIKYGPEKAVSSLHELVALYRRLFGDVQTLKPNHLAVPPQSPPKSSRGTIRSVFSRDKSSKRSLHRSAFGSMKAQSGTDAANQSRPTTAATVPPPQIRVTDGNPDTDGAEPMPNSETVDESPKSTRDAEKTPPKTPPKTPTRKGQKQGSVLHKKKRDRRPSSAVTEPENVADTTPSVPTVLNGAASGDVEKQSPPTKQKQPTTTDPVFDNVPHNMPHNRVELPAGHTDQPPHQDTRMSAPPNSTNSIASPPPIFLDLQHQRHKITVLVSVWLFIARLYTTISEFSDSSDAIKEAFELVSELEREIARLEDPSVARMQEEGWGGGSSLERLWADGWTEKGILQQHQGLPHDAIESFETALAHAPQHGAGTVGLCKILLDIYAQAIPAERPDPEMAVFADLPKSAGLSDQAAGADGATTPRAHDDQPTHTRLPAEKTKNEDVEAADSPRTLQRVTARDRAFALLESLTKRAEGWDSAEAWLLMGRAYEESGIIEAVDIDVSRDIREIEEMGGVGERERKGEAVDLQKEVRDAKGAYERAVGLADTQGVRGWHVVGSGGFVL